MKGEGERFGTNGKKKRRRKAWDGRKCRKLNSILEEVHKSLLIAALYADVNDHNLVYSIEYCFMLWESLVIFDIWKKGITVREERKKNRKKRRKRERKKEKERNEN